MSPSYPPLPASTSTPAADSSSSHSAIVPASSSAGLIVQISNLRHELARAQESERRAREASRMSSDRREQAEQRLLDVERENQRLQAAASMKTIRGDAYKASFDRNVEQRTQDNVKPSEVVATLESQVEEQNQRLQLVVDRQTADHGILSFRADETELTVATTQRDEQESRRLQIEADSEAARASLAELQRDCSALREELDRSRGQTRQAVRDRDVLQGTLDIVRGAVLPPTSILVIPSVGGSTIYKPPLRRRALRMSAPPMGSGPAYTPLVTTTTTPVSSAETSGGASTSHSVPLPRSERQRKVPKKAVSPSSASSKRLSSMHRNSPLHQVGTTATTTPPLPTIRGTTRRVVGLHAVAIGLQVEAPTRTKTTRKLVRRNALRCRS
ncbi:hypothetical protein PF008_g23009 [Phytophthora fragariae]|uniref:Uncharacterized protein n=1 Tax=Phytophthora fragariae TaxID=53985 RepID=A0A6G0QS86_9STRA|nr:hypothetical protein PF008_g23009 [Phytophthora fragariae]